MGDEFHSVGHGKLLLSVAGMVARDRRDRGVRLNHPQALALLSCWVVERAREGARVTYLMNDGRHVLAREDVMEGVAEMIPDVQIEATLVAACATLLAGDDLRLEIDVGANASLELLEPSGTVAYDARGGRANWTAIIRVAEGGCLVWAGSPFVVAHGADVHRHTTIDLAPGATMLLRETVVLGRSGEDGGRLRATVTAAHDGHPLLVEDLDFTDARLWTAPGILGRGRVLATTTLLGTAPDHPADPHETRLAGPGALHREITTAAHLAEPTLAATWTRWRGLIDN